MSYNIHILTKQVEKDMKNWEVMKEYEEGSDRELWYRVSEGLGERICPKPSWDWNYNQYFFKDKVPKVDWTKVETGTPMLVNRDATTKYRRFVGAFSKGEVNDEFGISRKEEECSIDTRRPIVWIAHDGSGVSPVNDKDIVVVCNPSYNYITDEARNIAWTIIEKYRVLEKAK